MRIRICARSLPRVLAILLVLVVPIIQAPPLHAAQQVSVRLHPPLAAPKRVLDFRVSPTGERIVFRVARTLSPAQDVPPPPPADLFSVPAAGGMAVQLNAPAANATESVETYQFSPDGSQIIYLRTTTDTVQGNVFELFSVPADGSAAPTSISGPIPVGTRSVRDFSFVFSQADIQVAFGDGSVRTVNYAFHNRNVPERITSIQDGTSNTFFFGEQANNLRQIPEDGSVRQINPGLVTGGVVYDFQITPDGTRAIYQADQNLDGAIELFSVPADGADTGFRISGPLVAGGDVLEFKVSADSTHAVYLADQTTNGVVELYSARTNGGIVAKLNAPLPAGGAVTQFQLKPDGSVVVHLADQIADQKFDLFSVATGGSASTLLSGGAQGGSVRSFRITPDGGLIVYADNSGPGGTLRLFSRPLTLDLSASSPQQLGGPPVASLVQPDLQISPDSSRVVYLADDGNDGVFELASISLVGAPSIVPRLNSPLVPGGRIRAFKISPDSQRVVYAADQNVPGVVELFSVPIGGGPVEQISGPLVTGGSVLSGPLDFQFSPDGRTVFYLADQVTDDVAELFAAYEAPGVAFTQAGYVVSEDGSLAPQLAVHRIGNAAAPAGIRVQLTGAPDGGTAKGGASLGGAGVDFVDNVRDVAFAANEITKTFSIAVKNDAAPEPAETFSMRLFEPNQVVTGTQDAAEVVILDTADSPLLADATLAVPENSANNTPVLPTQAAVPVNASTVTTYTILSGNTNNAFRIDNTGALFVDNSAALNFETTPSFALLVQALADNGSSDVATWTVNLQNQNEPPVFAAQTRSVAENSPNNSMVGAKLAASDPDADPLTFSTSSGVFTITAGGQLLVKDSTKLDFETQKQHTLTVNVADGKGLSKAASITVNVLDVVEGDSTVPVIASLNPGSAVAGGKDFLLMLTGKNFTASSALRWNSSLRKTSLSNGALFAAITAQDISAATTAKLDVFDTVTKKASSAVPFPVVSPKVGIAGLTIEPAGAQRSAAGERTVLYLDWTHTTHPWRTMDEMDLRLVAAEQIALWVRYQEATDEHGEDLSTVVLLNPDGTPAGSGRFGENKVLENDLVRLDLAQATAVGSGPAGQNIRVRLPVTFKSAAVRAEPYFIEMYGVDDLGGEQGPNLMGTWTVTDPVVYLPNVQR